MESLDEVLKCDHSEWNLLRWLERVLVFFDALYLGVKIVRLELANRDQILLQNNDSIKVSIFGRFLKKFVAMATQLGLEVWLWNRDILSLLENLTVRFL